ncbi:MAG: AI-2E family transporter [Chloroflexota bacterium]|nr:AI-2E family transporter [Chloroflexota bacterium]MDQ5864341.1 AI-2E family transporter [Chloroflexota bacterium]
MSDANKADEAAKEHNSVVQTPSGEGENKTGTEQPVGAEMRPLHVDVEVNRMKIPSVAMATAGVLLTLFVAWAMYSMLHILLLLFIAILLGTAIEPVVNLLRRGPFNRSAGILIVYSGLFLVIALIGWLTLPVILQQVGALGNSLKATADQMETEVTKWDSGVIRQQGLLFADALQAIGNQIGRPEGDPSVVVPEEEKVAAAAETAVLIAEIFFAFITIFVVAFYWLSERTLIKRSLMSWLPAKRANRVRRVWDDIEVKVGGWVRGQLLLMTIVGAVSAVGYFLMGIQYWPALALFIAVAEAIPLVGPYIGTAPAILVAMTQPGGGFDKALMVIIFAIVLQTIEGNVLIPRVMKNSVGISPLTVIISILFGATLAGLAGALVAVPLAGALQVIVSDLKAAHESEEKLEEVTAAAEQTRAEAGELVVATPEDGDTKTRLGAEARV